MKTFTSLSMAITLSFVHLLVEMWRGFLDFSLILPGVAGNQAGNLALFAGVYILIFAFWMVGLGNARQGKRGGILTALVSGALLWVGLDLGSIFFYCRGGCSYLVFDIASYVGLIVGALALFGLGSNLRQK
jgi:hypothetical protein